MRVTGLRYISPPGLELLDGVAGKTTKVRYRRRRCLDVVSNHTKEGQLEELKEFRIRERYRTIDSLLLNPRPKLMLCMHTKVSCRVPVQFS